MKYINSKLIWISLALVFVSACFLSLSWYHSSKPLELEMKAEAKQLFSSDVIELTLTAANTGDADASDISARIDIPEGLSLKASSPAPVREFTVLRPGSSASLTVYLEHDGSPVSFDPLQLDQNDSGRSIHDVARSLRGVSLVILILSLAGCAISVFYLKKDLKRTGILTGIVLIAGLVLPLLISGISGKNSEKDIQTSFLLLRGTDNTAYTFPASASYYTKSSDAESPYGEYRVVFDMGSEKEAQALSVEPGTLLTEQDIPDREGLSFAGWYLDAEYTELFEFSKTPVTKDMVLFTRWVNAGSGWDSDKDGIADEEERTAGSDPYGVDDLSADSDGDGLPDYWETHIYHCDPAKPDTDRDGLNDWFEALRADTDPAASDTGSTGTRDDLRDPDGDSLTNTEEQTAGTDPLQKDTDSDGLSDGDEKKQAGTDPLKRDTDGDSAGDGWESANGSDPLQKNDVFTVALSSKAESGLTASLSLECKDNPESVRLKEEATGLLDASAPGYLGGAFRFIAGIPLDSARISFSFSPSSLQTGSEPRICRYNEDTRLLEQLTTEIIEGSASADISQTGVYTLLDRTALEEIWEEPILNLNSDLYRTSVFDIAFVVDYSSSMNDNDPDSLRLQIVRRFIEKLRDNQDQATVIQFAARATTLVPLSSNKQTLLNAVDSITNASGEGCRDADLGTNGSDGIHAALEELKELEHGFKYIIFLTDGEDTNSSYDYEELVKEAADSNVTIFSIGMGDANKELLQHIAEATGGKFYFADSVDMDDTAKGSLMYAFHDIEISTIDLATDSNNDGISDYHTRMLCEGRLRTGTGMSLFDGVTFEELQANDDFDGDGKKNGEEIPVAFDVAAQRTYIALISSPTVPDSDGDGIRDAGDPAPLLRGMAEGICGKLSLVCCYNEDDSGWTSGRVFFVYTSFIDQNLDFSGFTAGFSRRDDTKPWSAENIRRDDTPRAAYHMSPGDTVTFCAGDPGGTVSGSPGPGYGLEIYGLYSSDPNLGLDYLHNVCLTQNVTEDTLARVISALSNSANRFRCDSHSCAAASCLAWNRLGTVTISPYDPSFAGGKIASPKGLKNNLLSMTGHFEDLLLEEALTNGHE